MDEILEKICKNYAFKSMDEVYSKLDEAALYIEPNPAIVKSITARAGSIVASSSARVAVPRCAAGRDSARPCEQRNRAGLGWQRIAEAPAEKERIVAEAHNEFTKAVTERGLSVEEYVSILEMARDDPEIRDKLRQRIQSSDK